MDRNKECLCFETKLPKTHEDPRGITSSKMSLESLIVLHQAAIQICKRFSKLIKIFQIHIPKPKTFVYITKHTAATLSISKIIIVSIVLNLTCRNVREEYIFISDSQVIEFSSRGYKINCNILKVSQIQNEFMWSFFLPKCQSKI